MATANSLDEFLSTELDESAVSALVGTLESRLASPTKQETAHSISETSVNNNHLGNANTTSSVFLHSITTQGQKGLPVNNVTSNNVIIPQIKSSQSDSQIIGINSIINSSNANPQGSCVPMTVNNSRNSPVSVNHSSVRIVSQPQTVINSRSSSSPSVSANPNSHGNVTFVNNSISTPNQVVINPTASGQQAILNVQNSVTSSSAIYNLAGRSEQKPVITVSHNPQISSHDIKPDQSHLVLKQESNIDLIPNPNVKREHVGSPQTTNQLIVKQETNSPNPGITVNQKHEHHQPSVQTIHSVPGTQIQTGNITSGSHITQSNVHIVNSQGKGQAVAAGSPSVITVRTPGPAHSSQVVMRPQLITTQSSAGQQMQVVSVSGPTVVRPASAVPVAQGKNVHQARATIAQMRPQQINIAPRPGTTGTINLPPGVQIPQNALIMRNEQGQLVFVTQQSQQAATTLPSSSAGHRIQYVRPHGASPSQPRAPTGTQIVAIQQPHSAGQQQTVLRQHHPSTTLSSAGQPGQIQTVVRTSTPGQVPIQPATSGQPQGQSHQQPLENVKKCKNFLSTLIKLASSQPLQTVKNVRELIQGLIDGKVEPQTFTEKLQIELKSSPQPYLVPFLKKSLPSLRQSLIQNKMTIDGVKPPPPEVLQQHPNVTVATLVQSQGQQHPSIHHPAAIRTPQPLISGTKAGNVPVLLNGKPIPKAGPGTVPVLLNGKPIAGSLPNARQPVGIPKTVMTLGSKGHPNVQGLPTSVNTIHEQASSRSSTPHKEKNKFESLKDDDDINDVATMGGVNLSEESKNILASNADFIGTQIRSCKDESFLFHGPLLSRINIIAKKHGIDDVSSDVINLVSHATQERLRDVVEKLANIAEHRTEIYKMNDKFECTEDVKSQLKFLEELDKLEKKRHEEQEWEKIMKAAKSRSKNEDPEQQKIKQKAKELQQAEIERMRQAEANQTALAAIGPRKKRKTDFGEISTPGSGGMNISNGLSSSSSRSTISRPRIKRVTLRDVLFFMEQERTLTKSTLLYKTFLK